MEKQLRYPGKHNEALILVKFRNLFIIDCESAHLCTYNGEILQAGSNDLEFHSGVKIMSRSQFTKIRAGVEMVISAFDRPCLVATYHVCPETKLVEVKPCTSRFP